MPVDFKQIDPEEFELLCEDLLQAMGFTVEAKVARGPDLGKDIIATETVTSRAGFSETHRYLVECKHYARSGRSVQEQAIGDPIRRMGTHDCDRYILATSTVPAEKTRVQLASISNIVSQYQATTWSKGDLARLLDQHPDVRERYFPAAPQPATPAHALADTVEGLLKAMGFACGAREQTDARRVGLVCQGSGPFAQRMLVGCKEGEVTAADVEGAAQALQKSGIPGGVLISQLRVSPAARDKAQALGTVRTVTLNGFYRELIDFEPYVRALVADYEGDTLSTYYVDLGCFKLERDAEGRVVGRNEHKPMDDYLDVWLEEEGRNHISILGDYGTGKTSFCRQYAAELGRRWLADPDHHRIPILISLRDYATAMNLEQLVTDFLVNRYGIQVRFEAFQRFNADGKLVLLFDGFDEMAQKVDTRTTVDNFEELARGVVAGSKVLITCRTPYFRTSDEAWGLFSREYDDLPESSELSGRLDTVDGVVIDLRERPNFEIVHLLPFDRADIQAILRARFPDGWEGYWQRIEETYNLAELAQRPVLLDMITDSLPRLQAGQAVNAAQLYQAYTDLWLARDWERGRTLITGDDKRLFMQALGLEMLRRDELSLHYSRLPEQVRTHFRLEKMTDIDYFEHDIRTCSFLSRDGEGNYRFGHKSFGEFFVAQWLAPRLLDGTAPEMRINEEIRGFVHGLLAEADWPPPSPQGVAVPEGMVWVPPGPFIYGEGQATQVVRIEKGFFAAHTPVTNGEYARFVAATGREPPQHWKDRGPPDELQDHPVVYVTWYDAAAYAEWAGVRLPTEQEWEKAARGIDGRRYPWGDAFEPARCNTHKSGIGTTTPVGRYAPSGDSPCGCADIAGNVWEWTASEPEPGSGSRVVRGGSFGDDREYARCALRGWYHPLNDWGLNGFRVVVSPISPVSAL